MSADDSEKVDVSIKFPVGSFLTMNDMANDWTSITGSDVSSEIEMIKAELAETKDLLQKILRLLAP